jgi:transketolase
LGSAVLETLADGLSGPLPPVKRLGIPDRFSDHYGSQQALMASFGIDAKSIVATVQAAFAESKQ